MSRILVVGDVVTDVVVALAEPVFSDSDTTASITTTDGGAGGNVACWLAAAGATPTLVARVGDDPAGREREDALRRAGVTPALAVDDEAPTGTIVVVVDTAGERTMLTDRGANLRLQPADVPDELVAGASHVHLSGYALLADGPRAAARHVLARAKALGRPVSVDPSSSQPLRAVGPSHFLEWTAGLDLCTPNRDELEVLTGRRDPGEGARELCATYAEVIVTLGAEGALWTDGNEQVRAPAPDVTVADTTGAGDAFTAGFLAARRDGATPGAALAAAGRLAARCVATPGARPR